MAAPASEDDSSFFTTDDRLVDRYLRAKIDGRLIDLAKSVYFVDADVCSAQPDELVRHHSMPARVQLREAGDGQQFYFFSPARFVGTKLKQRRSRTIDGTGGKESWHAEGKPKPVEGSVCGGYVTKFSYHVRVGSQAVLEKPGWIMAEYSFKDITEGDAVLCKVYRSPRGPGRSAASSSSAMSGCKRKASDDLEAPTPSTQPRITNQEDDVFALPALEAPEEIEVTPENVEQSQPEQQFARAILDETMALEDLENWIMTDVVDDGTKVQVPDGEDPDAYYMRVLFDGEDEKQDAAVHTAHGPLTDADLIDALATGVTIDELFPSSPARIS